MENFRENVESDNNSALHIRIIKIIVLESEII